MGRAEMVAARATARAVRPGRAEVVLIWGPPCSGKSTYVREHAQPGDLVVDYDRLAEALGSPDSHDHPDTIWPYVLQARDAVLDRINRDPRLPRAWVVRGMPTELDRARASRAVAMETSREECHRRADAAGRPDRWHALIDEWFEHGDPRN